VRIPGRDAAEESGGAEMKFFKGLLYAVPISLVLWALIFLAGFGIYKLVILVIR
jgi:hypothetical protein